MIKSCTEEEIANDLKEVINKTVRDSQVMASQAMGSMMGMPQA